MALWDESLLEKEAHHKSQLPSKLEIVNNNNNQEYIFIPISIKGRHENQYTKPFLPFCEPCIAKKKNLIEYKDLFENSIVLKLECQLFPQGPKVGS